MPDTAVSLGLSLKPVDERLNARRNAAAAARYLRRLHGRFGNWPLTLAAYNAGEGKVSGLLRKQKQKTFDAIAPGLPIETRMYVPRVLETIRLREKIDPAKLAPLP
jgi:membrane-bound lytic murein transglycosylase D